MISKLLSPVFAMLLVFFFGMPCLNASDKVFSRTRHKAGMLALIEHNETPQNQRSYTCKKAQISGICRMMVQEGGYDAKRLYGILNITDPEVEYVAMIMDELQGGKRNIPRIGSLVLASSVAFAYTVPSGDGMRAAVHAGRLGGIDEDCDAVCRAVYSLIIYAIEGDIEKKEELIKVAALNADSDKVARAIRSVRLAEWRKLPKESTLLGRLVRVLHLWSRSEEYSEAISLGNRKLLYPESRKLLAVLSACWTDLPYLPEAFVWKALMDKDNREICAELYNLADEAILARVSEDMVYGRKNNDYSRSVESVNGQAVNGDNGSSDSTAKVEFARPQAPATPRVPSAPNSNPVFTEETLHIDLTASSPSLDQIKSKEDSELTAIAPLSPLGNETKQPVRVVKPVDLFKDSFFAE